jgi:hypothetical protein
MSVAIPAAPMGADLATSPADRADVRRPAIVQGLLDFIATMLGREPDLHAGDDAHATDDEDEVDGF